MKRVESDGCLFEVDPLDIQMQIGQELGQLSCGRCRASCYGNSLSEVRCPGMVLYLAGDDKVDGGTEMAKRCKSRDEEVVKAVTAIEVTGEGADKWREFTHYSETAVAYIRPIGETKTTIQFLP